jgi:hypothetical protein
LDDNSHRKKRVTPIPIPIGSNNPDDINKIMPQKAKTLDRTSESLISSNCVTLNKSRAAQPSKLRKQNHHPIATPFDSNRSPFLNM